MIFFNHKPGDGLHYVNRGKATSEVNILSHFNDIISHHTGDTLYEVWNRLFPTDQMTWRDHCFIVVPGRLYFSSYCDPRSQEHIEAVASDLREIKLPEFAEILERIIFDRLNPQEPHDPDD